MRRALCLAALAAAAVIAGLPASRLSASVSRGSALGYRAADHNAYGVNNDFGMVGYSVERTTGSEGVGQDAHRRVREAGVGWIRYWLSWETVQGSNDPDPSHWNWGPSDHDIDAAIDQGLNVYVTIQGAPAWAHGGVPTYHFLQCYAGDDQFDPTRPGCGPAGSANAYAPFDPAPGLGQSANWKRFVHAAVTRYGDRVKYWGFWNEPTERHFWPEYPEGHCQDRLGQLVTKVIRPGREAALAANPSVRIVGPDDYLPTSIEHLLRLERDGGCGVPATGRLFDVIALHSYNIPGGGGVLNTIYDIVQQHFRREVWLTETNGGAGLVNALDHFERRGWIGKVFVGSMRGLGPCGLLNLLDGAKQPCASYATLQGHIAARAPAMHAAGTTGVAGHDDFVLLMNPHAFPTGATVHYSTAAGETRSRTYALPATSRTTLHVATEGWPGLEQGVSVTSASPFLPIWMEHADYWNGGKAGRLSQGTGERSDTWYFAEGVVGGTYWVHDNTAYNPSPTEPVRVTWQFMNASGTIAEATHDIAPRGHHRVRVNHVPGIEGEHATLVTGVRVSDGLPAPIVAERTIAWGNDIEGHATRGVPYPSTTWYFAEGSQGGPWSTFLLLMNPHDRRATVQVSYLRESGLTQPYTFQVEPRRRFTVAPPITGAFGIEVRSIAADGAIAVPIIAERAMYFGSPWFIGHATEGATAPSQRWMFAEGSTEGGRFYDPYLLLANPSASDAQVRLDFRLSDGSVFSDTVTVGAGRRRTVIPWEYPELKNRPFSTEVVVVPSAPGSVPPGIVAERAMYWSGHSGWYAAHSTMGMP
jgi:hypothetical protein